MEYGNVDNVLTKDRISFLLDDLFDHDGGTFSNWLINRDQIEQVIMDNFTRLTLVDLIRAIYQSFLNRFEDKVRWGCKVPYFAAHIDTLSRIFPKAKFVHMVRDPRAVYQSMCDRREKGALHFPNNAIDAAYLWRRLVIKAEQNGVMVNYFKIYYENLVSNDDVMIDLALFLNEEFSEANKDFFSSLEKNKLIRLDNVDQYVKPKMDAESGKRWQSQLKNSEIASIEFMLKKEIIVQNYSLTSYKIPFVVRVKCLFFLCLFGFNDYLRAKLV